MKYRIKEVSINGKSWYYPQYRFCFLWLYYGTSQTGYDYSRLSYKSLKDAEASIERSMEADKPVKVTIHDWNKWGGVMKMYSLSYFITCGDEHYDHDSFRELRCVSKSIEKLIEIAAKECANRPSYIEILGKPSNSISKSCGCFFIDEVEVV